MINTSFLEGRLMRSVVSRLSSHNSGGTNGIRCSDRINKDDEVGIVATKTTTLEQVRILLPTLQKHRFSSYCSGTDQYM